MKNPTEAAKRDVIKHTLSLFAGRCGHRWVGASDGYYGCPLCGDADGNHHLIAFKPITVQINDWGCAWERLAALARKENTGA
jgi:hypothetical protein